VKCAVCGPVERTQLFAVTIDGVPLRLQCYLCNQHGDEYLLRVGRALGQLLKRAPLDPPDEEQPPE